MIEAVCAAAAVLFAGAALRPRPTPRRVDTASAGHGQASRAAGLATAISRRRQRAITPFEVATWCEALSRAVRGGATLTTAIRTASPPASLTAEVDRIVLALDRGVAVTDALAVRSSSVHIDVATVVIRACAVHGGSAAEPLDRAAATLRARAADDADRHTHSAQARLSAIVMTTLPVAMLVLLAITSASTRAAVVSTPGLIAVVVGGALNVVGWRWMRHLIGGSDR